MSKECLKCKQTYLVPDKHFHKNKKMADGLNVYCKKCIQEMDKFNKEKKKQPKETRPCENEKCNNTFETRIKDKKYCCPKCAAYSNNQKKSKDRDYRFKYEFQNKFKNKKIRKNVFKRWTKQEDTKLINLRFDNHTFWEIAELLNRSYFSVGQRYRMLVKNLNIKVINEDM